MSSSEAFNFGRRIKDLKRSYNKTYADLTAGLKISRERIVQLEENEREPTEVERKRFADFYSIAIEELGPAFSGPTTPPTAPGNSYDGNARPNPGGNSYGNNYRNDNYGNNRPPYSPPPSYNDRPGNDRPGYGNGNYDNNNRQGNYDAGNERRPYNGGGGYDNRQSDNAGNVRQPGNYEDRPQRQPGNFQDRGPRPSGPGGYEDRAPRQPGNYEDRPPRQPGNYEDRGPRPSGPGNFQDRGPRPSGPGGYEDRAPRQPGNYEDRPPRQPGNYEDRGPRPSGPGNFQDRGPRPSGPGNFQDRGPRPAGDIRSGGEGEQRPRPSKPAAPKPPKDKTANGEPKPVMKYTAEQLGDIESAYLRKQRDLKVPLKFTFMNGKEYTGVVVDFTPFTVHIIEQDTNEEVILRKLAMAYYRKADALEEARQAAQSGKPSEES